MGLLDFPTDNMDQLVNIEMRSKMFQVLHEELENMPGLENAIRGKSLGDLPIIYRDTWDSDR